MFVKIGCLMALIAITTAIPAYPVNIDTFEENNYNLDQFVPLDEVLNYEPLYLVRPRRDIEFDPHINKQDGTTNAGATITHKGDNHEVTGHWNKNIRGPGRSQPNYGVRGSFKW